MWLLEYNYLWISLCRIRLISERPRGTLYNAKSWFLGYIVTWQKNKAKPSCRLLSHLYLCGGERLEAAAEISGVANGRALWNPTSLRFVDRAHVLAGTDMTLWVSSQTILVLCKYSYSIVKAHYTQGNYSPSKQTDVELHLIWHYSLNA